MNVRERVTGFVKELTEISKKYGLHLTIGEDEYNQVMINLKNFDYTDKEYGFVKGDTIAEDLMFFNNEKKHGIYIDMDSEGNYIRV